LGVISLYLRLDEKRERWWWLVSGEGEKPKIHLTYKLDTNECREREREREREKGGRDAARDRQKGARAPAFECASVHVCEWSLTREELAQKDRKKERRSLAPGH